VKAWLGVGSVRFHPSDLELRPEESITINEAVTDVPKSAVTPEIGWKPIQGSIFRAVTRLGI
jgi:hypothetical protein